METGTSASDQQKHKFEIKNRHKDSNNQEADTSKDLEERTDSLDHEETHKNDKENGNNNDNVDDAVSNDDDDDDDVVQKASKRHVSNNDTSCDDLDVEHKQDDIAERRSPQGVCPCLVQPNWISGERVKIHHNINRIMPTQNQSHYHHHYYHYHHQHRQHSSSTDAISCNNNCDIEKNSDHFISATSGYFGTNRINLESDSVINKHGDEEKMHQFSNVGHHKARMRCSAERRRCGKILQIED